MLGVVFTEFMEMVEDKFSFEVADQILEASGVGADTGFTAVAYYEHADLVRLVVALKDATGLEIDELVQTFGAYLFSRFNVNYPDLFESMADSLDFLERVEDYIHVEVRKLYPKAELPTFKCTRLDENRLEMVYKSLRPFGDLAQGLIAGCGEFFGETLAIERTDLDGASEVRFLISRQAA